MAIAPKVSLIIPVYNKAPFLRRCLDSVEPVDGLEVIIIDDHSTDGSDKICAEYVDKFQVICFRKKNQGVSNARNYGISKAKGDYIAFLDADDEYLAGTTQTLVKMAESPMSHNIIQFGHYLCDMGFWGGRYAKVVNRGWYDLIDTPKNNWVLVWNKLYKREFLLKHNIKFDETITFGEDEMFNVECLIANKGMWCVKKPLLNHHLDDKQSICRGGLCLEWLQQLDKMLKDKMMATEDVEAKQWLYHEITKHERSKTFREFGFVAEPVENQGNYDVVYMVKDTPDNEELRYSLRSLYENFPHNKVIFCGGKPDGLKPDLHIRIKQDQPSKWENVRKMLRKIADDERITEDFWLFNDDFFVLEPKSEKIPPYYDKDILAMIRRTEKGFGRPIAWTHRLRHLMNILKANDLPTLNYAVHKPMLMNRKKLKEVLDKFPDEPMVRALYGNYYKLDGLDSPDMKVRVQNYDLSRVAKWDYVSTQDDSFATGNIGRWLRDKFPAKSRFET